MPKAVWNGTVIAESDHTELVEGNHYFPPSAVDRQYLQDSDNTSHCPWKGDAGYYHVVVDGQTNENAAWYYAQPKAEAAHIRDHVAFWKGIEVQ